MSLEMLGSFDLRVLCLWVVAILIFLLLYTDSFVLTSLSNSGMAFVSVLCTAKCKLLLYIIKPFVKNAQRSFCNCVVCNMTYQWLPWITKHLDNIKHA